jgi:hypothetical protein
MAEPWWGVRSMADACCLCARVGALVLRVQRHGRRVRVWREWGEVTATPAVQADSEPPAGPPAAEFWFAVAPEVLEIVPRQPDRTVVSRPAAPIYVPHDQALTLYLETPLWLGVRLPGAAAALVEFPTQRLSDTWLGPSTLAGELAYASRLVAGAEADAPYPPHVARSPLQYRNRTRAQVQVARIALPAPALGVYAGTDGRLWSEGLSVEQASGEDLALASVGSGAPPQAGAARQLSAARARPAPHFTLRAVAALLRTQG